MKFFVPNTKTSENEAVYQGFITVLKDQLRMPITERRISRIRYVHDKRKWTAEVGKLEQQEKRYEILAIFEAGVYIVFTRSKSGGQGVTILVSKDEVTDIEYFD